jgi:hypothetical protein
MLDLVSNGRADLGIGEGATRLELGGFNIPAKEKRALSLEAAEQIANMMVMSPYPGFEGRSFIMPCRNVLPKPVQKPHPPMWMACTNRDTIKVAASHGLGALAFSFIDEAEARTWSRIYYDIIKSDACVPLGHSVNANIAMVSAFSLHSDREEAVRRGQEGFEFARSRTPASTRSSCCSRPAATHTSTSASRSTCSLARCCPSSPARRPAETGARPRSSPPTSSERSRARSACRRLPMPTSPWCAPPSPRRSSTGEGRSPGPARKRVRTMSQAATGKPLFRAEVVGSLLRPRGLKDAGRALAERRLSPEAFETRLDAEVGRAIARQEDIGPKVVTDGEFARSSWFGFFFEGFGGFRLAPSHFKFKDADGRALEWPA